MDARRFVDLSELLRCPNADCPAPNSKFVSQLMYLPTVLLATGTWLFCLSFVLGNCVFAQQANQSAQSAKPSSREPLVARLEMKLTLGEKVIDVIEKGDLLTVLAERTDSYVIQTFNGHKGAVAKNNAVKLAESIDIYNELIEANKSEGRLYTLRAGAWWALSEIEKALADYDKAIELGYQSPNAFASRGMFHASLRNFEKAIADYSLAIEKDPKDDATYLNRASVYMTSGKVDEAIQDYTRAVELKPLNAVLYQQRAVAHKIAGKLDEAIRDYDKAIELAPTDIMAWMGRGFVRFQQGDHATAVKDFTKVIELSPETAVAYNNRGYNFQQLGKYPEALADYDEAIKLAPKYGLAYQNKAWLHSLADDSKLRDAKQGIEAASVACELSEFKDINDLTALAAALAADGQFEKAIGWQEKVIELSNEVQKPFAKKVMSLYEQKKPFDPKIALQSEGQTKPKTVDDSQQ